MNPKHQTIRIFEREEPLLLESGESLAPIDAHFETMGTLNEKKDNVVLITHALTGDARAAGEQGWWSAVAGPGKAIDTRRFFVLCANVLGGCQGSTGPASLNPETGKPYGLSFPVITIEDMVHTQKKLLDCLGITSLFAVIGGSMGGMQALAWAGLYPQMVERCVPIATTCQVSPQALAYDAIGRHSIMSDKDWQKGEYYHKPRGPQAGLSVARMIGHISYLSEDSMTIKFGRELQEKTDFSYNFDRDFQVESYLHYQGEKFVNRFDANSYLYITKAVDYFDLPGKYGSLESLYKETKTRFLVISISSDILYPPSEGQKIVNALIRIHKEASYCELESPYGHDAFLLKNKELELILRNFLAPGDKKWM